MLAVASLLFEVGSAGLGTHATVGGSPALERSVAVESLMTAPARSTAAVVIGATAAQPIAPAREVEIERDRPAFLSDRGSGPCRERLPSTVPSVDGLGCEVSQPLADVPEQFARVMPVPPITVAWLRAPSGRNLPDPSDADPRPLLRPPSS